MKNIILIRHGKSSWDQPLADIDRPLKKRGFTDGALIANVLPSLHLPTIDAVFSSPAKRAYTTATLIVKAFKMDEKKIKIDKTLYDFSGDSVLSFIKQLDNQLSTVIIFGHNYAFTHIANTLGSKTVENIPTTGVVWLRFDEENWNNITTGKTQLTLFPKALR